MNKQQYKNKFKQIISMNAVERMHAALINLIKHAYNNTCFICGFWLKMIYHNDDVFYGNNNVPDEVNYKNNIFYHCDNIECANYNNVIYKNKNNVWVIYGKYKKGNRAY